MEFPPTIGTDPVFRSEPKTRPVNTWLPKIEASYEESALEMALAEPYPAARKAALVGANTV